MAQHLVVGWQGEAIAAQYLVQNGYKIHSCNVRVGHKEIDIIAYDPQQKLIVFVEVKTRSHWDMHYRPELNMTWRKKEHLRHAAKRWLERKKYEKGFRIDLICVADGEVIEHYEDVCAEI